ncbi:efflux RND transporter periplasmic adaptor subunit [Brucella sp. NBRC 12950]|uniref:efflux RND transporter periplasmic adaptor subunit n=1 Tax=Brucella sp. NBRC 12950 TaxID=2994518 RepID=UPI0024A12B5A|nr:efflux RND transporter periplasmic adaptor subunit [Brucella sp. NBRC 12950]GLU29886.1 hemolysin secretion protein D [Brucella sp. NBRC 12950]
MTRLSIFATAPVVLFAGTALGLTFVLIADNQTVQASPEIAPRLVKSVVVKTEPPVVTSFAGVVQARIETDLAFRTLGRVISRKVEVGDLVHNGDVLAEIDPLALQLVVTGFEADLRNAQAQLQYADVTEKRKQTLATTNAGSVADLELARQGLKSAQAGVAKAQASLDKAREQLGYAQLKAEFDGVVTATSAEIGQVVTAGQSVIKVAQLGQRDVVVDVPETLLGAMRLGTRFDIALQLDNTLRTPGILREIAPEADSDTRTYRLKIAVEDAPEVFRLGSVVTASAVSARLESVILLPSSAVLAKDGANSVWVIDPAKQTISSRPVHLDLQRADTSDVRVLSGLREGEDVVVAGVNELWDGQKVKSEKEPRP